MDNDEPLDLIQLHLARLGKDRSTALPARYYRNPSDFVEFDSETKRKEKAKSKSKCTKGK